MECWEVGNLLPESGGSSRGPSVLNMNYNDELIGVDVLTWPMPSTIWPPTYNDLRQPSTSAFAGK